MRALAIVGTAALAAVVDAAESEQKPCTAHMCGSQYDLSPLSSSTDYVIPSHSGRNFTLNVCRSVATELWSPRVDRPQDVGGFYRGDHGDFSIGQANTTVLVRDMHPVLYMTGGTSCPQSESMKASTAISFVCDTSIDKGEPRLVAQLPPEDNEACAFFIEWKTKYACALPDPYAYWKTAVMVIVILLALTLTLLALLALHKLLKRRRLSDPYSPTPLPNGTDGIGGPRSWPSAIADRARDAKRFLTGQDPWGHPNGYHHSAAGADVGNDANYGSANGTASTSGGRKGWFSSLSFSVPWSRSSSSARRNNFNRLPRSAEEEAMMGGGGGGPFSVDDDDDDDDHDGTHHASGRLNAGEGGFAEESAAWGAARPRGIDTAGVIRL